MAYSCDDVYEDAELGDETHISLSFVTSETALVASEVTESATAILHETAVVLGVGWLIAPGDLFEVAVITGVATPTVQCEDIVLEEAFLSSAVYPPSGIIIYETAVLDDLISSATSDMVDETAVLGDLVVQTRLSTTLVVETAVILGELVPGAYNFVNDAAVVLGDALPAWTLTNIEYETAVLNDLVVNAGLTSDVLDEVAVLDDSMTLHTEGSTTVTDEALIAGYAIMATSGDAWVSVLLDPAMSRHEGLLSSELVEVDGTPLGMSAAGMYALTADGIVPSEILTGITDFNDPQLRIDGSFRKHVMWVYAVGKSDAAYNLRVLTDDEGNPVERIYAFPFANGAHIRNTRCQLGKRTWARFWQFAFTNDEPHTLSGAQATIELTARRA